MKTMDIVSNELRLCLCGLLFRFILWVTPKDTIEGQNTINTVYAWAKAEKEYMKRNGQVPRGGSCEN